jgi:glycosyltransferase involved in cell wall biosynthesis
VRILVVHQNFPGQYRALAPALLAAGHQVFALSVSGTDVPGVTQFRHQPGRSSTAGIHPWVTDFETKVIRGESAFRTALVMREQGLKPDFILCHHGWGEGLFLKHVWPEAKLALYCEFFYRAEGTDVGFDPEFSAPDPTIPCRLDVKNVNNAMHMAVADAGISPTRWQASTFPEPFRGRITVIHDGIDTSIVRPNVSAALTLNGTTALRYGDEVITFVNRNLEPYRGYHTFMRALPEILRRRPKARAVLVGGDGVSYGGAAPAGETWRAIFWREVAAEVDPSRVHFVGALPYSHYLALMQVSAVHVYFTYPFVLGWSCIEAMSAGCAVVASYTQPVTEVISDGETGLLVNFFDHHGLANRVCALLEDRALASRLGIAAREVAVDRYDLERVCLPAQIRWVDELLARR